MKWDNAVAGIHVAGMAGEPLQSLAEVSALAGRGLDGDRYITGTGTFSEPGRLDQHVTLIEREAIEALERESNLHLEPGQSRRNIETRGVPLNHLVGVRFRVGEALLLGMRLCEPCSHLAGLTDRKVLPGLVHRGGLRAQVLEGGRIRVGDRIELAASE
jgi:MOSC domain-containing protein YiiM